MTYYIGIREGYVKVTDDPAKIPADCELTVSTSLSHTRFIASVAKASGARYEEDL